jgi:23S rRNA G2069 N7-methylase RlmK/C1962 C5-methylase RlmI
MAMPKLFLRPGHDKPVRRHHPWIFSGAVARIDGQPDDGDIVEVYSSEGEWLARGYLNRRSQIVVRLLTWDREEAIDESFWHRRIDRAVRARTLLELESVTDAYRLVFAESDWIPGLIVDRYADFLVLQCLTLGIERRKELLVRLLAEECRPAGTATCARRRVSLPRRECAGGSNHRTVSSSRSMVTDSESMSGVDTRPGSTWTNARIVGGPPRIWPVAACSMLSPTLGPLRSGRWLRVLDTWSISIRLPMF